jgi:hypothetical protein
LLQLNGFLLLLLLLVVVVMVVVVVVVVVVAQERAMSCQLTQIKMWWSIIMCQNYAPVLEWQALE